MTQGHTHRNTRAAVYVERCQGTPVKGIFTSLPVMHGGTGG